MKTLKEIKNEPNLPAVTASEDGIITFVNVPFELAFGWTKAEIIGKPLVTIIPPDLHDAHHMGFSRFIISGSPTLLGKPLKLKAVHKDGHIFAAEHYIVAEKISGEWEFGATIRPL